LTIHLRRTDGGGDLALAVDDVISATGFVAPLRDLPDQGLSTYGASRLPAVTPWWESVTTPGVFAAGTLGQASKGLRRHGVPANSGAVHGARYNARVLAEYIARTGFGIEPERAVIAPDRAVSFVAGELAEAPDLFHQRGYLARVLAADPRGGWRDDGVQPLAHVLDTTGPDLVAFTLDSDGSGAIYPVVFARHGGTMTEHVIDPDPLGLYDTDGTRRTIAVALRAIDRSVPAV
jgi:hypothetical protein